jgi:predicted cupin superfamily sugar epimerase
MQATAQHLIEELQLVESPNGGLFRQIHEVPGTAGHERSLLTIIHYLLTPENPVGVFHRMSAAAVHYFHFGAPMRIYMLDERSGLQMQVLGADLAVGEQLQVIVPGGVWKALELVRPPYSLISEAVCPGWVPYDDETANRVDLVHKFPLVLPIEHLIRSGGR